MAERIELPPTLQGDEKSQLQQLWSYLYQMSESLNNNLQAIGSNDLTDNDRKIMQKIIQDTGESAPQFSEMETLKSLIIKTADFVQTSLQEYRLNLLGESVASGQFGRYVRNTGLDVEVTPEGITQNYSFEEVVQGLKEFSVNAKNYIKTGLLRTVSGIPVYGVAIGKDVVTFAEDGTETYNDGNKVAELTADELSFWQNSTKIASYKGNRISFFYNGSEAFYIQNGKVYCVNDLELASGKKLIINTENFKIDNNGKVTINGDGTFSGDLSAAGGTFKGNLQAAGGTFAGDISAATGTFTGGLNISGKTVSIETNNLEINGSSGAITGKTLNGVGQVSALYGITPTSLAFANGLHAHSIKTVDSVGSFSDIVMNAGFLGNDYGGYIGLSGLYVELRKASGQTPDPVLLPYANETCGIGNSSKKFKTGYFETLNVEVIYTDIISLDGTTQVINPRYDNTGSLGLQGLMFKDGWIRNVYYMNLYQQSSREVKEHVENLPENGDVIDRLRPVKYEYKKEPGRTRFGLIHEETAEVLPEICTGIGEEDPERRGIDYVELIPLLLKEIQSLRARVAQLESRMGGK